MKKIILTFLGVSLVITVVAVTIYIFEKKENAKAIDKDNNVNTIDNSKNNNNGNNSNNEVETDKNNQEVKQEEKATPLSSIFGTKWIDKDGNVLTLGDDYKTFTYLNSSGGKVNILEAYNFYNIDPESNQKEINFLSDEKWSKVLKVKYSATTKKLILWFPNKTTEFTPV